MNYTFELSRDAGRYLRRLDMRTQQRMAEAIRTLCEDPFHSGTKPLHGTVGLRAARVGGWRIVYEPVIANGHLLISEIGPRGQVYRNL